MIWVSVGAWFVLTTAGAVTPRPAHEIRVERPHHAYQLASVSHGASKSSGGVPVPPAAVEAAITAVFGSYASEALSVAWCESRYDVNAVNGQYFGLFQMGESERAIYGGSSTDPTEQSQAAFEYFADTGFDWSPWGCKP